jgi:hypothetical protein
VHHARRSWIERGSNMDCGKNGAAPRARGLKWHLYKGVV